MPRRQFMHSFVATFSTLSTAFDEKAQSSHAVGQSLQDWVVLYSRDGGFSGVTTQITLSSVGTVGFNGIESPLSMDRSQMLQVDIIPRINGVVTTLIPLKQNRKIQVKPECCDIVYEDIVLIKSGLRLEESDMSEHDYDAILAAMQEIFALTRSQKRKSR